MTESTIQVATLFSHMCVGACASKCACIQWIMISRGGSATFMPAKAHPRIGDILADCDKSSSNGQYKLRW